jgi:hypothetical protein
LEASSLFELRLTPERLSGEIAGFLDEAWAQTPKRGAQANGARRRARAAKPA